MGRQTKFDFRALLRPDDFDPQIVADVLAEMNREMAFAWLLSHCPVPASAIRLVAIQYLEPPLTPAPPEKLI